MVEKNEIVERLKAEGQLTRNTGTNSIKATNERIDITNEKLEKLSVVFTAVSTFVDTQTSVLKDMLNLDLAKEAREKRQAELEAVGNTQVAPREREGRSEDIGRPRESDTKSFWPGLFSMIGGALGGLGGAIAGVTLGGIGIAALIMTLAEPAAEFIADFLKAGLEDLGMNPETAEAFKEYLKTGVFWALIGRALGVVFGRRLALLFAAGGILWKALDDAFGATEAIQRMADAFDIDLSEGWAEAIGAAIGVALISILPKVIKKIIPKIFGAPGIAAGAAAGAGAAASGAGQGRPAPPPGSMPRARQPNRFLALGGAASIYQLMEENQAALEADGFKAVGELHRQRQEAILNTLENTPFFGSLMRGQAYLYKFFRGEDQPRTTFDAAEKRLAEEAAKRERLNAEPTTEEKRDQFVDLQRELSALIAGRDALKASGSPTEYLDREIADIEETIRSMGMTPITTVPSREITPPLPPLPVAPAPAQEYPSILDTLGTQSDLESRIKDFLDKTSSDAAMTAAAARARAVIIRGGDTNNVSITRGGTNVVNSRTSIGGGGGGFFQGSGFMGDPFGKLPIVQ